MMQAYRSGDPYLAFAKQAGAVPSSATKVSHKAVRDQFKACVLAVQYGMSAKSWPTASDSRRFSQDSFYGCTEKRTASSGDGLTALSIMRC